MTGEEEEDVINMAALYRPAPLPPVVAMGWVLFCGVCAVAFIWAVVKLTDAGYGGVVDSWCETKRDKSGQVILRRLHVLFDGVNDQQVWETIDTPCTWWGE
jgi:hypothetical protein